MKKFAVIVGGGKGIRLGSDIPKQFLLLNKRPVIFYTIEKFVGIADEIVLVLPESHFNNWNQLFEKFQPAFSVTLVKGGSTRSISVKNGLAALSGEGIVAVHDAVRPLVSQQLVTNLFEKALISGNSVPVVAVKDSLRKLTQAGTQCVNRDDYRIVQTPQCFDLHKLAAAYAEIGEDVFSDDASIMEQYGTAINTVEGETTNIKITFKEDLAYAEAILAAMKG
jgi:2-C-methyl-D-erythritol 4-phosphate cytidylyltransferase